MRITAELSLYPPKFLNADLPLVEPPDLGSDV